MSNCRNIIFATEPDCFCLKLSYANFHFMNARVQTIINQVYDRKKIVLKLLLMELIPKPILFPQDLELMRKRSDIGTCHRPKADKLNSHAEPLEFFMVEQFF